jgi:hypothetical protein
MRDFGAPLQLDEDGVRACEVDVPAVSCALVFESLNCSVPFILGMFLNFTWQRKTTKEGFLPGLDMHKIQPVHSSSSFLVGSNFAIGTRMSLANTNFVRHSVTMLDGNTLIC